MKADEPTLYVVIVLLLLFVVFLEESLIKNPCSVWSDRAEMCEKGEFGER